MSLGDFLDMRIVKTIIFFERFKFCSNLFNAGGKLYILPFSGRYILFPLRGTYDTKRPD
jgi:hypothetical protein